MGNTQSKMFPTNADFDKTSKDYEPAMKWADLPAGIYSIEGKRELNTQFGDAMILTLKPSDGVAVEVWAPERIIKQLKSKSDKSYIRNNGFRVSQKNKTHKYHSFDLL